MYVELKHYLWFYKRILILIVTIDSFINVDQVVYDRHPDNQDRLEPNSALFTDLILQEKFYALDFESETSTWAFWGPQLTPVIKTHLNETT